MNEDRLAMGIDGICPVTHTHCDDECCPPGASCNLNNSRLISGENPNL